MRVPALVLWGATFGLALSIGVVAAGEEKPPAGGAAPKPPGGAKNEAVRRDEAPITADVEDEFGIVLRVDDVSFYRPSAGLMVSSKGTKLTELRVWKGAHEILVPLRNLVRIDVRGKADHDLVEVRVIVRNGGILEGKVERDLEIHGIVQFGQHVIKFERLKSVVIRS